MTRKTIAQRITEERQADGQKLLGVTSGWYSFRKSSNLSRKLEELGLTKDQVDVRCGAKKRYRTEGTELLIFSLQQGDKMSSEKMTVEVTTNAEYWRIPLSQSDMDELEVLILDLEPNALVVFVEGNENNSPEAARILERVKLTFVNI